MAIYKNTPPIVTNGLVLHLDAGSRQSYVGSGNTWTDLSGQGNNGTLQSSPTFGNENQGSITFNGTTNYISTTTNLGANPLPTHSISVWFKTSVASGAKIIGVENTQTGTATTLFDRHIYMGTDGKIYYGVYDTAPRIITSISTLNNNNWHNVVGICTGTSLNYLYIDGILNGSTTGNAYPSYITSYIRLGSYRIGTPDWTNSSATAYFTGSIANVQVYNRALSSQEIAQNYNALKSRFGLT